MADPQRRGDRDSGADFEVAAVPAPDDPARSVHHPGDDAGEWAGDAINWSFREFVTHLIISIGFGSRCAPRKGTIMTKSTDVAGRPPCETGIAGLDDILEGGLTPARIYL